MDTNDDPAFRHDPSDHPGSDYPGTADSHPTDPRSLDPLPHAAPASPGAVADAGPLSQLPRFDCASPWTNPVVAEGLRLSSVSDIVVAIPHLLGFVPTDSVVVLAIRSGYLVCTMRVDLVNDVDDPVTDPRLEADPLRSTVMESLPQVEELARVIVDKLAHTGADSVVIALFAGDELVGPAEELGHLLELEFAIVRMQCTETLIVQDHDGIPHVRSVGCYGSCCPPEGTPIDPHGSASGVAAEFVGLGRVVMGSRDEMASSIRYSTPRLAEAVARAVDSQASAADSRHASAGQRGLERWRDERIDQISGWLDEQASAWHGEGGSHLSEEFAESAAAVLVGLADVRVRDTVMHRLFVRRAARSAGWNGHAWILRELAANAPSGWRAPAATLAGLAMWQSGDGARGLECLRVALEDDPTYSLAHLIVEGVCGGLPPETWAQALGGLTEWECRYGTSHGRRKTSTRRRRRAS